MISVDNITFTYPRSKTPVLKGFSADFQREKITAIRGKNGCGKTTLTKLITGILKPETGHILIDGHNIVDDDLFQIGQKVGYLFQNPNSQLFCETVYKEIAYGLENMGLNEEAIAKKASYYLDYFNISHLSEAYPAKLSQGEKQRVMLSVILAMGNQYLILDEPTSGLDMKSRQDLGLMLEKLCLEQGLGIIIVSHDRDFMARYAQRELVMGL